MLKSHVEMLKRIDFTEVSCIFDLRVVISIVNNDAFEFKVVIFLACFDTVC